MSHALMLKARRHNQELKIEAKQVKRLTKQVEAARVVKKEKIKKEKVVTEKVKPAKIKQMKTSKEELGRQESEKRKVELRFGASIAHSRSAKMVTLILRICFQWFALKGAIPSIIANLTELSNLRCRQCAADRFSAYSSNICWSMCKRFAHCQKIFSPLRRESLMLTIAYRPQTQNG